MGRMVLAAWLSVFMFAVPSFASDAAADATSDQSATATESLASLSAIRAAQPETQTSPLATIASPSVAQTRQTNLFAEREHRPLILPALYVGAGLLQAADIYTTMGVLKAGGREANPLMQSTVGSQMAFIGVKAAITVGSIVAVERMWHHNRVGAILLMAASNGMMAAVSAHNLSVIRMQEAQAAR